MKDPLEELVREARGHLGAPETKAVDWAGVDDALFARIEREQRDERRRFVATGRRWPGVVGAAAAAAAMFAFAVHDSSGHRDGDMASLPTVTEASEIGGRIAEVEGDGRDGNLLIDGRPALRGATIRLGDVIEVQGPGVVIERPGKLTMRIEGGSRAVVTHTDGSLIVALARGAVEAQVVPVPRGEAFAVDVDGSRVAVHGTHLRVARVGDRVTVDLNEGVVAVGNAPRVGSVVGSLVTAPAHAEFVALDVSGSLAVRHDLTAVRAPVPLGPAAQASAAAVAVPVAPAARPASGSPVVPPPSSAPSHGVNHPEAHPSVVVAPAPEPTPAVASPVDPNPERALREAVRACMDQRPPAENVTVLVSTTLRLDLADDGAVRAARFDPPVAPDVNTCAAAAIYRTRFPHGGTASIPVDFSN